MTDSSKKIPLYVDLDGTLIKTDLLWESLIRLIKQNPLLLFVLPFWLLKGKAGFKEAIAQRVDLDVTLLPYHQEFLNYIKDLNRPLILVTASVEKYAKQVAEHLGIFSEVMATAGGINLSGSTKLKAIQEKVGGKFGYAGNAKIDCTLWDQADEIIMVNPPGSVISRYQNRKEIKLFIGKKNPLRTLIKTIRLHQWMKNLLIFVPLVLAHRIMNSDTLVTTLIAFLSFGCCASSVYICNDLADLDSDRAHATKCNRPLASGNLSIGTGILIFVIMLTLGVALATQLSLGFQIVLGVYFVSTTLYSFWLKSLVLIDVVVLSLLYTLRIFAGGMATGLEVSQWLLTFSLFIFFSLSLAKRYSELKKLEESHGVQSKGRGYRTDDMHQVASFGSSCGFISVLVMSLYINSDKVTRLYNHPQILWAICPVLLYWTARVWLLAHRGLLHEDPVVFALTDRVSYVVGLIAVIAIAAASY